MSDLGMRSLDNLKQPSPKATLVLVAIFQILAIVLTVLRLVVRFRKRRLWWEDLLAGVAAVGVFIALVTSWVRIDSPPMSVPGSIDWKRVDTYWFVSLGFTCVLWAARMSIMFSIIRITPPMHRLRVVSKWSSTLFVVFWLSLMAQKLYICTTTQETWHLSPATECHLGKSVAILELCTDFVSDSLLVVLPLLLLWNTTLLLEKRRLIMILFSASILTLFVSVVHAVFLLGPTYILEGITADIEAAVSLIVCNLLVCVTFLYGVTHKGQDIETFAIHDYQIEVSPSTGVYVEGPITSIDLRNIATHPSSSFEHRSREFTNPDSYPEFSFDKA